MFDKYDKYSFSACAQPENTLDREDTEMTQRGMNFGLTELVFCSEMTDLSRQSQSNSSAQTPMEKELGLEGN